MIQVMSDSVDKPAAARTPPQPASAAAHADAPDLRLFVFALFFIFGGITSLNDVVIPKLKGLFTLKYGEVMLVQSAFFAAYFVFSVPAAVVVRRVGYMRGAVIGLLLMTAGCLLFIPAAAVGVFATFLAALFVLAAGITVIQVVANPLISLLGHRRPRTVASRSPRPSTRSGPRSSRMSDRFSSWVRYRTSTPRGSLVRH
jgi:FHS family L-fucose permease-like MFS transporter